MFKVVIVTQNDPFYLGENIDHLIKNMPGDVEVKACVVFDVSPFGKQENFFQKILRTYKIFGISFVVRYGGEYLINQLRPAKQLIHVLRKHNVPIIRLEQGVNKPKSLEVIRNFAPDLLVSIAANQIFKRPLLDIAQKGCINLHTSLLPKYRGLMPTFWVLKNQEKETGVSVFLVDEGIDSGPIVVQKKLSINGVSQRKLILSSKKLGMEAIIEAIEKIKDENVNLIENPDSEMTYYSFPTRKDVKEFLASGNKFY